MTVHSDSAQVIPPRAARGEGKQHTVQNSCHAQHVPGAFGAREDDDAGVPVPKQHVARGAFGARGHDANVPVPEQHRHGEQQRGSTGHADRSIKTDA